MREFFSGWKHRLPGSTKADFGLADHFVNFGKRWWLTPLAQHLRQASRSRFLPSAPPLRRPGAVCSPVTPAGVI